MNDSGYDGYTAAELQTAYDLFMAIARKKQKRAKLQIQREDASGAAKGKLTRTINLLNDWIDSNEETARLNGWVRPLPPEVVFEQASYTFNSYRKAHDKATKQLCEYALAGYRSDNLTRPFRDYIAANAMVGLTHPMLWAVKEAECESDAARALLVLKKWAQAINEANTMLLDGSVPRSTDWFEVPIDSTKRRAMAQFLRYESREYERALRRGWDTGLKAWQAFEEAGLDPRPIARFKV